MLERKIQLGKGSGGTAFYSELGGSPSSEQSNGICLKVKGLCHSFLFIHFTSHGKQMLRGKEAAGLGHAAILLSRSLISCLFILSTLTLYSQSTVLMAT